MSLDIIAYDPKETKARKNKFKAKYGISYDKFDDEMIKPRKDMFCYYLHPELLESDIKEYEEMDDDAELIADVDEVDSFHIGYGQFNFLRKELGELVGIRYDDSDVFNTRIYYDDCYKNTSLLNFFLHSDWDGMTYLGFDKKGYSYELTQKEHDYFKLVRNAKLDDFLGKLGKAGNEIDNSLKTGLSGLGNLGR